MFCRTWTPVEPKRFFAMVDNLLLPRGIEWSGVRTVAQLRRENGVPVVWNRNSEYRPVHRKEREFDKLHIPRSLNAALPFELKEQKAPKEKKPRNSVVAKALALTESRSESRKRALLTMLDAISKSRQETRKESKRESGEKRALRRTADEKRAVEAQRELKKRKFARASIADQAKKRAQARRHGEA